LACGTGSFITCGAIVPTLITESTSLISIDKVAYLTDGTGGIWGADSAIGYIVWTTCINFMSTERTLFEWEQIIISHTSETVIGPITCQTIWHQRAASNTLTIVGKKYKCLDAARTRCRASTF
jgi:hypothetical protein